MAVSVWRGVIGSFKRNKTLLRFMSSSFIALPISLVTGFLTLRNIDPFLMGIWATLSVFDTYANFMRMGVINGMNRELPLAFGKNEPERARAFASATLGYTLLVSAVLLICVPIYVWNIETSFEYRVAAHFLLAKILLNFYSSYLTGTFRSSEHFNKLSNIMFASSFSRLLFCPLVFLGFYGFLIYDLLYNLFSTFLYHRNRPLRLCPNLRISELKHLTVVGLPIFIVSYAIGFIDTLPRLYIIFKGNEYLLGLIAPVGMLLNIVATVPNSLTTYLYPKYLFNLGKENNPTELWRRFFKVLLLAFVALIAFAGVLYFFLGFFADIFPKYKDSEPYLYLALLLCPLVFYKMGYMLTTVFKQHRYMIMYVLMYGVIQVLSLLLFSFLESDVLKASLYSQLTTFVLVIIGSVFLNRNMISELVRQQKNESTEKVTE